MCVCVHADIDTFIYMCNVCDINIVQYTYILPTFIYIQLHSTGGTHEHTLSCGCGCGCVGVDSSDSWPGPPNSKLKEPSRELEAEGILQLCQSAFTYMR